ncbi:hypothetical protein O181_051428 [Austropuccinia psidii MF-1]|uniref:Uncharacterized protein n=1 Tax=Austropuccinia psidii MF-1 TaxID=1389203 RepID=A0A9Q3E0X8_9BASI|nr:hypothetical protein [Austropuccinia psidii MF-1]
MSPVHLRNLGCQRNKPEDREGLSGTRRPGRGHLGHSGGWQDTEGNHTHPFIHFPIQQEPKTRGLERYGSSSSAPPTTRRFISMERGLQEVQPGIPLGRTWRKFPEDLSQRDRLQRPYGNHQRENQATIQAIEEQLTQTGHTQITSGSQGEGQISSPVASNHSKTNRSVAKSHHSSQSQEVSRQRKGYKGKKDHLQPEEERVRYNDPETVGFSERSAQEPEVVVHNSRISSPLNRHITPTQIEHNVFTPESNLNSDAMWLQISQYSEKTQTQFAELEASHKRMKILTASMDKIVKNLQEGHSQLSKASEETNKRLNLVFEEQHHSKRDRDCLNQDIKKPFDFYHSMKPQPQGHVMDNPYYQDDLKPDFMLINNERSPSQYQDGDNMSYSEKGALKQLPEASSLPKFSGTGEYDNMELIDYINGLFIDVPSIPDYWITARMNTEFKGHASIWYTEMKKIHGRRNWPWWKSQIIQKYSNGTWYGKRPCHLKMTSTLWIKIHMSGVPTV